MTVRVKIICLVALLQIILMVTMGFFLVDEYQTREAETFQRVATSLKNAVVREQKDIQKRYAKRIAGFVKSNQAISQAFIRQDHDQLVNAIRMEESFITVLTPEESGKM